MSTSPTWPILERAHASLRTVVTGIPDDAWGSPTPCEAWTVTQVFQHATGDQQGYAGILTGTGFPTDDPFAPSGVLGDDALSLLEPALAAPAAAFAAVPPDAAAVAVPLPQGPQPAWIAVGACALDAAVHAWDIAVATGQPSPLDDAYAAELLAVAVEIVEPLRGFAYAAPLAAPGVEGGGEASVAADLLRYLGRDPHWQPAA